MPISVGILALALFIGQRRHLPVRPDEAPATPPAVHLDPAAHQEAIPLTPRGCPGATMWTGRGCSTVLVPGLPEQTQKDIYRALWSASAARRAALHGALAANSDRCAPPSPEPCARERRDAEQRFNDLLPRYGISRAQWDLIEIRAALNQWAPPPPEPWKDLDEQARRDIFRDLVWAQERSLLAQDARNFDPKQSLEPWLAYDRQLDDPEQPPRQIMRQSEDAVLRRHGISQFQGDQIGSEAMLKMWPLPGPEPAGSTAAGGARPTERLAQEPARDLKSGSVRISEREYGDRWPFVVAEGTLRCEVLPMPRGMRPTMAVTFAANANVYAINGTARVTGLMAERGYRDIVDATIWKDGPRTGARLEPLIRKGLEVCGYPSG